MKFIKKHKKGLIILLVIAAIITAIVIWFKKAYKQGLEILTQAMGETAIAENRDLVKVVSAVGKVTSVDSKSLSSLATGAKIKNVYVEIGDEVKAGDILVELDSDSILENLENAKDQLSTAKATSNLSISSAQRMYNEQVASNQSTIDSANKNIADMEKQIKDMKSFRDQAENLYKNAKAKREEAERVRNELQAQITLAQKQVSDARTRVDNLTDVSANGIAPEYIAAVEELTAAEAALADANANATALATATAAADGASAAESTQLASYNQYESQVETLEKNLENLKNSLNDTVRTTDSALAARKDSVTSAKLQASNSTDAIEKQIDTLEDQMDECLVKAPFDGIVTSLMAEEGATYAGTPLVTVEDVSAFEITTEIDEYDIGNIKKGQKVVIKTNGTGDEELEGVVKSVAPRASMGQAVTYTVVVSVLTKNDMLRLDMTAKLSIILESTEDTLTVPYEAVLTDGDGNEYVQVVTGKDANGLVVTEDVYVKTGIKSDYYVEILEGIKEGTEVKVQREASSIFDFSAYFTADGSAMGGM